MKETSKHLLKIILFIVGFLMLVLAFVGLLLPIVPATPFALLSAFCFSKSSPTFHRWLLGLPFLGPAIVEWSQYRVIRPRAKVMAVLLLLGSMVFICLNPILAVAWKVFLSLLLAIIVIFILTRKSHLPMSDRPS